VYTQSFAASIWTRRLSRFVVSAHLPFSFFRLGHFAKCFCNAPSRNSRAPKVDPQWFGHGIFSFLLGILFMSRIANVVLFRFKLGITSYVNRVQSEFLSSHSAFAAFKNVNQLAAELYRHSVGPFIPIVSGASANQFGFEQFTWRFFWAESIVEPFNKLKGPILRLEEIAVVANSNLVVVLRPLIAGFDVANCDSDL
jgi:hypothetical protein